MWKKKKKTAPGWKSLTLGKKRHSEILKIYISRQSNLQIQCNCYQNSNRMFPINRTNDLKNLHGTTQTTLNSQNKLDKERCRRHHTHWSQTKFKVIAIKMLWYCTVVQSPSHFQLFATPQMQHARLPCPSSSPEVCPSSCPLHRDAIYPSFHYLKWMLLLPPPTLSH